MRIDWPPASVTKTNGSEARTGFDLESADNLYAEIIYGNFSDKEWEFKSDRNRWNIGRSGEYVTFSRSDEQKISAILGDTGDTFAVSGQNDSFTISSGTTVLNYNSRGLINGYESNPATFSIYEYAGYSVSVTGGTAESALQGTAMPGSVVTIIANDPPDGKVFDHWEIVGEGISDLDISACESSFVMPEGPVKLSAVYMNDEGVSVTSEDVPDHTPLIIAAAITALVVITAVAVLVIIIRRIKYK